MSFQPGAVAGEYQVLDVLGKGGMGRVYRVRHLLSQRIEAMKVLLEDIQAEPGMADRFLLEIQTVARLDHPNIAKLHTAFKADQQLVMVMEFVEGANLADRAPGPMPLADFLRHMRQILGALGYAHQQGVVHRDLKPSNIMLSPGGTAKLMDFGLAKSSQAPMLTQPGTTMGTLAYMSPEQVRGESVDARSDLYSLGLILYELTAGRAPFEAETTYGLLEAQLKTTPPPPRELNPALPQALNDIILTAVEKEPGRRFQSAQAFQKALESIIVAPLAASVQSTRSMTVPAAKPGVVPPTPPPPASRKTRARALWMASGAVAALAIAVGAMITVPYLHKAAADAPSKQPVAKQESPAPPAVPTNGTATEVDRATPLAPEPQDPPTPTNQLERSSVPAIAKPKPILSAPAAAQATPEPQAPPPPAAESPAAKTDDASLNLASDQLVKLEARAEAVHQSLAALKQQQAADGYGLRRDVVAAESRLTSYLQLADRQLQNRDADAAQRSLARAEDELTTLEKFLGR